MAKRSKGAPGIYELEPGLFKVVVSLGRSRLLDDDEPERLASHDAAGPARFRTAIRAQQDCGRDRRRHQFA